MGYSRFCVIKTADSLEIEGEYMRAIGRGIGRFFAWLGVTILGLVIILVLIVTMIVHGPSAQAKNLFVTTMLETGQAKWAVGLFLSKEEIEEIVNMNAMATIEENSNSELINVNEELDMSKITVER